MNITTKLGIFPALFIAFLSTNVHAQGHCSSNEATYFSCKIKSTEKHVSLCGSPLLTSSNDELKTDGWLQYRFGKLGQPEFTFPQNKKDSLRKFVGDYESLKGVPHFWYNLLFQNGSANYQLGVSFGDLGGFYGIRVSNPHKTLELSCEGLSAERFNSEDDGNLNFASLIRALKERK